MLQRLSWLAIPLVLAAVVGCDTGPKLYPVTGKVTIKGEQAPEKTRVNFEPTGGGGEMAAGIVDAAGNYTLYYGSEGQAGALAGSYKVYLAPDASGSGYMDAKRPGGAGSVPGMPGPGPIPKEFLSATTSPMTVTVAESDNTIDITIE